ncbi:MAG: ABC transporter ATP-binding protein [Bacteroidales bacterium]
MTGKVLELAEVDKAYGARSVVRRVSFELGRGERVALLGHNGAGKTTLMKMMLGLTPASGGTIRVLGHDPAHVPVALRRLVGFLPENVAFDAALSGRDMLAFFASLKRRPDAEVDRLLDLVGLAAAAGRRIATYSKGMRQRLGLAQALLGNPRLLLLDEPTSGLDPELRAVFYAILAERAAQGAAVLLSSHLLTELEERTDRILVMDRGRLVASGTLEQLRVVAALPLRLRGILADGGVVELACAAADKMAHLRALAARADVVDVTIEAPGLAELYAHFTGGKAA